MPSSTEPTDLKYYQTTICDTRQTHTSETTYVIIEISITSTI